MRCSEGASSHVSSRKENGEGKELAREDKEPTRVLPPTQPKKTNGGGGGGGVSMGPKRRPHVTLCRQLMGVLARS